MFVTPPQKCNDTHLTEWRAVTYFKNVLLPHWLHLTYLNLTCLLAIPRDEGGNKGKLMWDVLGLREKLDLKSTNIFRDLARNTFIVNSINI